MTVSYIIYSTPTCRFCRMAKELLIRLDRPFEERDITRSDRPEWYDYIKHQMGFQTVPQIFEVREGGSERHIGGYESLKRELGA